MSSDHQDDGVDPVRSAGTGVQLVGDLIRIAGENPEAREAGKNLGKAALTITTAINNCLLPLAALNFGIEKAKAYFNGKFQEEIARKISKIPADQVVPPKPSLVMSGQVVYEIDGLARGRSQAAVGS
jgi:hypothetical protein